jgi:EAL domain-containing protein (putative c-di-GMP-specific phosphodiesterase class I)
MKILREQPGCGACKDGISEPFPFTMAFQPIVDIWSGGIYAYEALARGPEGQSAAHVLAQVNDENRYSFDQNCRVKAITLASRLNLVETGALLSINFMPRAVYDPAACIKLTLRTARELLFPLDRLVFEIVEAEKTANPQHLVDVVREYRNFGFQVALDDFGAGWSGLNLLADLSANTIKLDMALTRNLGERPRALIIVRSVVELCRSLNMEVVAEGVETVEEYRILGDLGVRLMQGYLFAKPGFEHLPPFTLPVLNSAVA